MRIAHVLYRLDVGGLETVVVNLINHLPQNEFRHDVISLTECTDFKARIHHPDVTFHALGKREGQDFKVWFKLWRLLHQLKPDLIHTCNIATLEAVVPAFLAGVPVAIHAEHGRDMYDLDGSNWKYIALRRILRPWVDCFVPVSKDLETWLLKRVRIPATQIRLIVNGIDLANYSFRFGERQPPPKPGFAPRLAFIIGTVGRLWPVKDQVNLVRAFAHLCQKREDRGSMLRLILIGDGPQRQQIEALIAELGIDKQVWITGWRQDVANLLGCLDLFVLPSMAEGTPLTILEAMAVGLPVVATRVGGVADLVISGETGLLVPPENSEALAKAIASYVDNPSRVKEHGSAGRKRAVTGFSLERVVEDYRRLFQEHLLRKRR